MPITQSPFKFGRVAAVNSDGSCNVIILPNDEASRVIHKLSGVSAEAGDTVVVGQLEDRSLFIIGKLEIT